MNYKGKYSAFDTNGIKTYPLKDRSNKVTLSDMVMPDQVDPETLDISEETAAAIDTVAQEITAARKEKKPVIVFTGAHLVKNGLGPLLIDLVKHNRVTLVAGNGATAIHDFELALIGETSENVPNALGAGEFGMAYEFSIMNNALTVGNRMELGFGESLGKMICEPEFRAAVLECSGDTGIEFTHEEVSLLSECYKANVPLTIHTGIGTDVIDQHPSFSGEAKGGCSGRDFLIFTEEIAKLTEGGVILNIGSAVTGPEVVLKAVSMAANTYRVPDSIICVDFDLRPFDRSSMDDESKEGYYFRDQKSIVTRIPDSFGGKGFYIQGNQKETFPYLYAKIIQESNK